MPSREDSYRPTTDPFDSYIFDGDDLDDLFASSGAEDEVEAGQGKGKAKEDMGIDKAVTVTNRARVPRVKLDESR